MWIQFDQETWKNLSLCLYKCEIIYRKYSNYHFKYCLYFLIPKFFLYKLANFLRLLSEKKTSYVTRQIWASPPPPLFVFGPLLDTEQELPVPLYAANVVCAECARYTGPSYFLLKQQFKNTSVSAHFWNYECLVFVFFSLAYQCHLLIVFTLNITFIIIIVSHFWLLIERLLYCTLIFLHYLRIIPWLLYLWTRFATAMITFFLSQVSVYFTECITISPS